MGTALGILVLIVSVPVALLLILAARIAVGRWRDRRRT